jgi:hypothetical protein
LTATRREALWDRFPDRFVDDEAELIAALDYFVLQHELRNGKTVVERFVASRPDLPEHERELLLGWCDVVEGIFEVHGRDGARTRCSVNCWGAITSTGPSVATS